MLKCVVLYLKNYDGIIEQSHRLSYADLVALEFHRNLNPHIQIDHLYPGLLMDTWMLISNPAITIAPAKFYSGGDRVQ